ncbi:MAG: TatD family hydrolase [Candidatus Izemoplasmatales bacterium]|jgi:TatD DNase family protein|nr:TatD family hydrolase [Candidatus Izemoplasmatales bacterium]MDD4595422.1 TatD family hydrolase [Candidatus Izemoplasmatales bacterium]
MLFDSHCHLNDNLLFSQVEEVIAEAKNNEVGIMICVGYGPEANRRALELAHRYSFVYAAIGFHPEIASQISDADWQQLRTNLSDPRVVAIGECGLDYYWDKTYRLEQIDVFKRQITLAKEFKLPLIIHMREATEDTFTILQENKPLDLPGVMHCYSGSVESMFRFIDLNMNISLAGPVTFKNAKVPKDVAKAIPDARLMIETDSPYLSPMPYRGKTNEPKHLKYICNEIALLRNMTYEQVEKITAYNATRLFNINLLSINGKNDNAEADE